MALTLNGSANTIGGLAVGGVPDGTIDTDALAANAVVTGKITDATIATADLSAGVAKGVAKAWFIADNDGGSQAGNRNSWNIDSWTDHGTGDISVTFTNDFANVNYVAVGVMDQSAWNFRWTSSTSGSGYATMLMTSDRAVGSCRMQFVTTSGSMQDAAGWTYVFFGD